MKGKKYYSVVADNGLMVSNNWEQVIRMRKYFRGDKCKGYKSKEDAIIATKTEYNEQHEFTKYFGEIILNEPYFSKNMNKEGNDDSFTEGYKASPTINAIPMVRFEPDFDKDNLSKQQ